MPNLTLAIHKRNQSQQKVEKEKEELTAASSPTISMGPYRQLLREHIAGQVKVSPFALSFPLVPSSQHADDSPLHLT